MSHSSVGRALLQAGRSGFTLVELVIVIVIVSVTAGVVSTFLSRPLLAYNDLTRRAGLVDGAETALRRIARDVHAALPNSLRIASGGTALELIHTSDGGRYRKDSGTNGSGEPHLTASDRLDFTAADSAFNIVGRLSHQSFSYGSALPSGSRVAIYTTGSNVYSHAELGTNPGVITPITTSLTVLDDTDEDQITLSSPHLFLFESPRQRVFLVDTAVTYLCDLSAGTLTRYADYSIESAQPTDPLAAPLSAGSSALLAVNVGACEFRYVAGTLTRAGLLTLEFELAESGESVTLLHQLHVGNAP